MLSCFNPVQFCVTLWTEAQQSPLSMRFPRQEYQSGLSCHPPGGLTNPRIESVHLTSTCIGRQFLYYWHHLGSPLITSVCVLVTQLCLTLCESMNCSLPGSSVRGVLQARILAWVAKPFSRGSSWPRDEHGSPWLQADSLPFELPRKPWVHDKLVNSLFLFSTVISTDRCLICMRVFLGIIWTTELKALSGISWWLSGKECVCRCRGCGFHPWSWFHMPQSS